MYQILAGVIIIVCFLLGMNSRSISGGKEETKIPPDQGGQGVKNSASLGDETAGSRERIKSELARLARADKAEASSEPSASCYKVSGPPSPVEPPETPPQPMATCYAVPYPEPPQPPQPPPPLPKEPDIAVPPPKNVVVHVPATHSGVSSVSRDRVRADLKKLAGSTPPDPKSLIMHAKCYEPMMDSDTLDYVCDKCKTKTVFTRKKEGDEMPRELRDIVEIRRLVANLAQGRLNIYLDESACCSKCSDGKPTGDLYVEISYSDGVKPVRTRISMLDLKMIQAFLDGKDRYNTQGPDCAPLKDKLKRLEEIFAVTVD